MRWLYSLFISCFITLLATPAFPGQTFNPFTGRLQLCITIEEEDGSPSFLSCGTLKVNNGSLTDNGDNTFSLDVTAGGAGAGGWTDDGVVVRLTTSTDNVSIGTASGGGKLFIDGDGNEVQFQVQGHSTQTAFLALFEQSDGTDVFTISNSGDTTVTGIVVVTNKLGVANAAPVEALDVTGNTKTSGEFIEGTGSTGATGGYGLLTATKTAGFTADATTTVYFCDASSAAFTVTLPAASTVTNRIYYFKKTDTTTNDVTLDGNGSETIDGAATYTLTIEDETVIIISDGTNWAEISGAQRFSFINTGLVIDAEVIFRQKFDIGIPGSIQGLDIGEGGSYSTDTFGTTIVEAFNYDASATSGSRFTALTLGSQNTLLGAAGDRIYFGSPNKFWATRVEIGVAKSTELYAGNYWNGSALTAMTYMGIKKDAVTSVGDGIMEQTGEKEYISVDRKIDSDWATADNVLDAIPDTTTALYWVAFQVPGGGFATPPRIDEIKVRGTDSDFNTGTAQLIFWGKARVENHMTLSAFTAKSGGQPAIEDIQITSATTVPLLALRNSQSDGIAFSFKIPEGTDTSCKLELEIDFFSDNSGSVDFTLQYYIAKEGTTIGSGQSDTASVDTTVTLSGADQVQIGDTLSNGTTIDVSTLNPDDIIFIEIIRKGSTDTNSGKVYIFDAVIHFILWTQGEHV